MLSHRRRAQLGLASASLLLITTLTILYQGSQERAVATAPHDNLRLVADQALHNLPTGNAQVAAFKR
jgi:hypothetical protein